MKAITIKQPWAWAIIHNGKDIENRTWKTKYRGKILIHAGKQIDKNAPKELLQMFFKQNKDPLGAIIGQVEITDCVDHSSSKWFQGPYGFVLKNPEDLPAVKTKGQLGLWEYNKGKT